MNIKKGDTVYIISGNDKGKTAKVLHVQPKNNRLIVEGVNMVKRHQRPTQRNPKGGILTIEAPIHRSNVKIYCNSCSAPTRVSYRLIGGEEVTKKSKLRVCRQCGAEL